jgi:transcriptional regulator with XRE-family HTH domain
MSERSNALARRLEREGDFLASALAKYARAGNLSDEELAARLGCEPSQLAAIRLCRMPRSAQPHFRHDIDRIAEAFQIDALVLAEAVRLANSLDKLDPREDADGFLMAARDRAEGGEAKKDGDE